MRVRGFAQGETYPGDGDPPLGIGEQSRPWPATDILSQHCAVDPVLAQLALNVVGSLLLPKGAAEQVKEAIPPKTAV